MDNENKTLKVTIFGAEYTLKAKASDSAMVYKIAEYVDNKMRFYVRETVSDTKVATPQKVYEELSSLKDADQESFWILGLNVKNMLMFKECVSLGGTDTTIVDPRIIFKRLLVKGVDSFILVHNHPSGNSKPSNEDIQLTNRIKDGAEILGMRLLDHMIIGENYFSFREQGLL